jgi:hypothetical protein
MFLLLSRVSANSIIVNYDFTDRTQRRVQPWNSLSTIGVPG